MIVMRSCKKDGTSYNGFKWTLELNVEDNPNWKEKEEWPDIPVLQPITLPVRQLNPEAWK
jgi:hypothetical protein